MVLNDSPRFYSIENNAFLKITAIMKKITIYMYYMCITTASSFFYCNDITLCVQYCSV